MIFDPFALLIIYYSVILKHPVLIKYLLYLKWYKLLILIVTILLLYPVLQFILTLILIENIDFVLHIMKIALEFEVSETAFDSRLWEYVFRAHVYLFWADLALALSNDEHAFGGSAFFKNVLAKFETF